MRRNSMNFEYSFSLPNYNGTNDKYLLSLLSQQSHILYFSLMENNCEICKIIGKEVLEVKKGSWVFTLEDPTVERTLSTNGQLAYAWSIDYLKKSIMVN